MDEYAAEASMPVQEQAGFIGGALDKVAAAGRYRQPTVREQVQERINGLERQLAAHRAVLAVLDETPGVEKVLDALRKIGV